MPVIGEKAKLLTALDRDQADRASLQSMYSIEVSFERSPEKSVLCGAIVVFRLNKVESNLEKILKAPSPELRAAIKEAEEEASQQTDSMYMDPIYFKEPDGQWVAWAINRALALYDQLNGNAKIIIKSAKLRCREERTSREVAELRNETENLFRMAWRIDQMLRQGFSWDPRTRTVRRGRIDVNMAPR